MSGALDHAAAARAVMRVQTGIEAPDFGPLTDAKQHGGVVDPGFMVDWGVYCPPDQPHSPDQPR